MTDNDLEKRLSALSLARASDDYLDKGLSCVRQEVAMVPGFWRRYLPLVLASALVVSVSANIFQLLNNRPPVQATGTEQMAQCNTPATAASPVHDHPTAVEFATQGMSPRSQGMC